MMNKTVVISSVGVIFTAASATMLVPFLPLYLMDLGCSEKDLPLWSALVFSSTFLVGSIVMPWWGALGDRVGKKKMMLRSAGCLSLSYFIGAIVLSPVQLLGMRILQGFSFGFVSIGQAMVTSAAGRDTGKALGLFMSGRSAGTVMGPFIGGMLAHWMGIRWSFITAGFGAMFAFFLVLFFVREPMQPYASQKESIFYSFRKLSHNRDYMHLLGMMMINQMALLIINPVIAVHIGRLAGDMSQAAILSGLILGAGGLAGMMMAPFWGSLGQRKGFYVTMCLAFIGDGIFTTSQFFAHTVLLFGILQFGFGLFLTGGTVSIVGAIAGCTDASSRGSAYGLNSTAMNLGNFMGPVVGGIIASWLGTGAVFLAAGLIQLCAGLFIMRRIVCRKS